MLNQYGTTTSHLHGGLPTDRCVAEWHVRRASRGRAFVDGEASGRSDRSAHRSSRATSPTGASTIRSGRARYSSAISEQFPRAVRAGPGRDRLRARRDDRHISVRTMGIRIERVDVAADPHAAGPFLRDQLQPHVRARHRAGGGRRGRRLRLGRSHRRRESVLQRGVDRLGLADPEELRRAARAGQDARNAPPMCIR